MNRAHNLLCSSSWWDRRVREELVPWGLDGVDLGDEVLELGPGFGATTRQLAGKPGRLSVVELDEGYCARLRRELGDAVTVACADAGELPFEGGTFSAVVCFTMLHHIAQPERRDAVFAQAARVLRPGGTFAGTDSLGTGGLFKLIHLGDALLPIDPDRLPGRLEQAGLAEPRVERGGRSFRFRARKPARA